MSEATHSNLSCEVVTIKDFLANARLSIPIYQRPYKWSTVQVNQLVNDIKQFSNTPSYRLGTVVLHEEESHSQIVDGQQRTITLMLLIKALYEKRSSKLPKHVDEALKYTYDQMPDLSFANPIAQQHGVANYRELLRLVVDFNAQLIEFLLYQCEFVVFRLHDVSEAFQFFDSQNSRGKDLAPHDLLKAYHLRAFEETDHDRKYALVDDWESTQDQDMARLFAEYLYRIKSWIIGEKCTAFRKNDIGLFKGITVHEQSAYPFTQSLRMIHHCVEGYNASPYSRINQTPMAYPFQLDAPILNGRRFFEMISHYDQLFNQQRKSLPKHVQLNEMSQGIFETLDTYKGRNRTGDACIRLLFDTLLLFYVDKFGETALNTAVQYFFIWSYRIRLKVDNLSFATVNNQVIEDNLYRRISQAYEPHAVFVKSLVVDKKDSKVKYLDEIRLLFDKMNY